MLLSWPASFGRKPIPTDNLAAHYDASVASSITEATGVSVWQSLVESGNSILQSENLTATWSAASNVSFVADQYVAPDGTTTMDQIKATAGSSTHYGFQTTLTFSALTYTASAYVKYDNHQWIVLNLNDAAVNYYASFDILNGLAGAKTAGVTSSITEQPDGSYRITITKNLAATAGGGTLYIGLNDSDSASFTTWNAAGTEVIGWWGAQINAGSTAAAYVKTTTTAVADRALVQATGADQPAYSAANNSITFDGVSEFLKTAAFTLNQPTTIYLVMNNVTWTANSWQFDGNTAQVAGLRDFNVTPRLSLFAGGGDMFSRADMAGLAVGSDGVVAVVFNSTSSSFKVNNTATATGDTGTNNMSGLTLGAAGTGGAGTHGNIIAYEVAIYSVAHTASEQNNIIHDLMQKWTIS